MPNPTNPTPFSDAIAPLIAPFKQPATAPATQADAPPPAAGGSYTRDPATGVLTLATPSTHQE